VSQILRAAQTVAVVGLSDRPWRASHGVSSYLQSSGYKIVPVNPNTSEALGEPSVARLEEVAVPVDVIDVFRRAEFVNELVDAAIKSGAKLFWMQEGIRNSQSAELLREAGLEVVEDRCLMVEHMRLLGRT
jgi:predicted CoA-binding protein